MLEPAFLILLICLSPSKRPHFIAYYLHFKGRGEAHVGEGELNNLDKR